MGVDFSAVQLAHAQTAICWPSPSLSAGPALSPTSAPACSGTTPTPPPTGWQQHDSPPSGTATSRRHLRPQIHPRPHVL